MLLKSDSQKESNLPNNNPLRRLSNKKKLGSFLNYSVKQNKNYSKFYSSSLNKSKKMNLNPRINIIINNNNPINYTGSPSSMYINSFSEKSLKKNKNREENSTFIFTGDNQSCIDDGQIIENYLKNPLENPIFECKSLSSISNKEQNEIIPSQEKSFALSSSFNSYTPNTTCTIPKKKNNKNLIKMLKLINSDSGNKLKENKNKQFPEINDNFPKQEVIIISKKKNVDNKKKIGLLLLLIINLIIYLKLLVILFQPPVSKFFYDNDHIDYKYTISSLSYEKGIVMNDPK